MEELVLSVPREALAACGLTAGVVTQTSAVERIVDSIERDGDFLPRSWVEKNSNLLQPIPCALVHSNLKLLVLRRKEQKRSNPIHDKLVIWLGGHVRSEDVIGAERSGDLLRSALYRELREEAELGSTGDAQLHCVVWDARSSHFGMVFDVPVEAPNQARVQVNQEFRRGRGRSISGQFLEIERLSREFNQMEPWSRLIWSEFFSAFTVRVRQPKEQLPLALA